MASTVGIGAGWLDDVTSEFEPRGERVGQVWADLEALTFGAMTAKSLILVHEYSPHAHYKHKTLKRQPFHSIASQPPPMPYPQWQLQLK